MAAELVFAPESAQDIHDAYQWYENWRVGLGEEFMSCVDACLQAICRQPEMHAKVRKEYRRALLRRFPYAVFYEHVADTITVFGVLHTARNPESWQQRLS
jgi:plasmid stabilization system protein ParE